jgi:hypothetical protein
MVVVGDADLSAAGADEATNTIDASESVSASSFFIFIPLTKKKAGRTRGF